jgi:ribosomal-protein-alanine N-acetyltransferase
MNTPILLTERLNLRLLSISDLDFIHHLLSLPETDRYNTAGIPGSMEVTKIWIESWLSEYRQNELFPFLIELKPAEKMIGLISLRLGKANYRKAEVSYKIHPDAWSSGYATEALKRVINFGFSELKLHRIEAGTAVENTGSIRVLEKAGMQREGICRQNLPLKSGWSDNYEYAILETDLAGIK